MSKGEYKADLDEYLPDYTYSNPILICEDGSEFVVNEVHELTVRYNNDTWGLVSFKITDRYINTVPSTAEYKGK